MEKHLLLPVLSIQPIFQEITWRSTEHWGGNYSRLGWVPHGITLRGILPDAKWNSVKALRRKTET